MIPDRTLTGRRCFCSVCGLYFKSDAGFDKHRTGDVKKGNRRCLSVKEMLSKKMIEIDGWWVTAAMPKREYENEMSKMP